MISHHDHAGITRALADHKREGREFSVAWALVCGAEPQAPPLPNMECSVERFFYLACRQAYAGGGTRGLDASLAAEESYGGGRKARPASAYA